MNRFALMLTLGAGLALASVASAADVTIQNFNSPGAQQTDPTIPFFLDAKFAAWGAGFTTLTSEADGFKVRSHNYGSGYKYLGPVIDAGDNDFFRFDFTVSEGVAGMIVDLVSEDGEGQSYKFYGLTPGNGTNGTNDYTFTVPIASGTYFSGDLGILDKHHIVNMNIEIDPGPTTDFYTATFKDVSATTVPEPTSALAGAAIALLAARRRR